MTKRARTKRLVILGVAIIFIIVTALARTWWNSLSRDVSDVFWEEQQSDDHF